MDKANIRVKTAGAANTTDMAFDISNAGTVTQVLNFDGSVGGAATFNSSVTIPTIAYVGTSIVHQGDTDTSIDFATDTMTHYTGGLRALDLGATFTVFNTNGADVDFRVESAATLICYLLMAVIIAWGWALPHQILHSKPVPQMLKLVLNQPRLCQNASLYYTATYS